MFRNLLSLLFCSRLYETWKTICSSKHLSWFGSINAIPLIVHIDQVLLHRFSIHPFPSTFGTHLFLVWRRKGHIQLALSRTLAWMGYLLRLLYLQLKSFIVTLWDLHSITQNKTHLKLFLLQLSMTFFKPPPLLLLSLYEILRDWTGFALFLGELAKSFLLTHKLPMAYSAQEKT